MKPSKHGIEFALLDSGAKMKGCTSHNRVIVGTAGQFAMELARMLTVQGFPDGETSTGEVAFRIFTPSEAVNRAVEVTELLFDALAQRKWSVPTPPIADLVENGGQLGFTP